MLEQVTVPGPNLIKFSGASDPDLCFFFFYYYYFFHLTQST